MRPPSPPPLRPAPLSFEPRRWTVVFSLPFAFVMGFSGAIALLWMPQMLGRLGIALGIPAALLCLALAVSIGGSALKALRHKGPALVIDERGITDSFHLNMHLPWSAIAAANIDHGDGRDLMVVLRAGARLPGGGVMPKPGFWRGMRRAFSGGDLRIPLGGLAYHPTRLREALKAHLAFKGSDEAR